MRIWHVSKSLPTRWRYGSDVAIAVLLLGGACALEQGRPWWIFYAAAAVGGGVVTAVAQALAVRSLRELVGP